MKRIVVEELANGDVKYIVETDRKFFGWFKTKWHTDTIKKYKADGDFVTLPAIFDDIDSARMFAGFPIKDKQVISRDYIYE